MNRDCFIYTLANPVTGEIRYVGKSMPGQNRDGGHCKCTGKTYSANWVRSLKASGLRPKLEILEDVSESEWEEAEIFWIQYLKFLGFRLTNATIGGRGCHGISAEAREKISAANRGKKMSISARKKISDFMKTRDLGKKMSAEHKLKISISKKGKPQSSECRAKIKAALQGKLKGRKFGPHTKEHNAKISNSCKGKKMSPESRARMSIAQKGKIISLECRAKLSAINTGKILSIEHRAKISNSLRRTLKNFRSVRAEQGDRNLITTANAENN